MTHFGIYLCIIFVIMLEIYGQHPPPRLQIPGAVLVSAGKPNPILRQRLQQLDPSPSPRLRGRPLPPNAIPLREVRPVVEELEEEPQQQAQHSHFDDEVARLGLSNLHTAVQQAEEEPERQVQFRPERPVPVLRENIRDYQQVEPIPVVRQEIARPVIRQQLKQEVTYARPVPARQEIREEVPVQHVRRPVQQQQQHQHQQSRPAQARPAPARIQSRPAPQYLDDEDQPQRGRKPPVQILRKYRTDNADGSITWGYENEDGSFKEENIGIDCITRGKYGYVDPDGVKREYSYETGGTCEEPEEELEDLPKQQLQAKGGKKPYRLPPPQYVN